MSRYVYLVCLAGILSSCGEGPPEETLGRSGSSSSAAQSGLPEDAGEGVRVGTPVAARTELVESGKGRHEGAPRPNILWIVLDCCRARSLSCHGFELNTSPCIDALAQEGVLFEQAYVQANRTRYSVPTYMTGRLMTSPGVVSSSIWHEQFREPLPDEQIVSDVLRAHGYETCLITTHTTLFRRKERLWESFDHGIVRMPEKPKDAFAAFESVMDDVYGVLERERKKPLFLYLHVMDPHSPYPREAVRRLFRERGASKGDDDSQHDGPERSHYPPGLLGWYLKSIVYTDACVGDIIDKLESTGLSENTLIILTADHGEVFPPEGGGIIGHGDGATWDGVLHVPLIMVGPGIPKNVRVSGLAQAIDIFPTLLEYLDISADARLDGTSLLPLLENPADGAVHDFVVSRDLVNYHDVLIIRDRKHKYVYRTYDKGEELYPVPDTVFTRPGSNDVARHLNSLSQEETMVVKAGHELDDVLDVMRTRLRETVLPLWEEYQSCPMRNPDESFEVRVHPLETEPGGAFAVQRVRDHQEEEGPLVEAVWSYDAALKSFISAGWAQDAPPLTFNIPVPNLGYSVSVKMHHSEDFGEGHPASAVLLKLDGSDEFTLLSTEHSGVTGKERREIDAGVCEVADGVLSIMIDDVRSHWSGVYQLHLQPAGQEENEAEKRDRAEQEEQLQSLGYLD